MLSLSRTSSHSYSGQKAGQSLQIMTAMFQGADTDKLYTHGGVREMSRAFRAGLRSRFNWRKGDILTLFVSNSIDIPAVMLGTLLAGGTFSPANPGYTVTELANQLADSHPKAIATQYRSLSVAKQALQKVGMPRLPGLLLGAERDPSSQVLHFTELKSSSSTSNTSTPIKIKPKTEVAFLVHSSGTTGKPQGVQRTTTSHRTSASCSLATRNT
ncbi:hypothetical protein LTR06_011181 [Exophiala xenobiotica]|nr:hypothetical protein LTR06_011181 [Exophiala xenobiotica]